MPLDFREQQTGSLKVFFSIFTATLNIVLRVVNTSTVVKVFDAGN